jgi:hypothetical protein
MNATTETQRIAALADSMMKSKDPWAGFQKLPSADQTTVLRALNKRRALLRLTAGAIALTGFAVAVTARIFPGIPVPIAIAGIATLAFITFIPIRSLHRIETLRAQLLQTNNKHAGANS